MKPEQEAALEVLLDSVGYRTTSLLICPAGSGKTTVINALVKRFGSKRYVEFCLKHKPELLSSGLADARIATRSKYAAYIDHRQVSAALDHLDALESLQWWLIATTTRSANSVGLSGAVDK